MDCDACSHRHQFTGNRSESLHAESLLNPESVGGFYEAIPMRTPGIQLDELSNKQGIAAFDRDTAVRDNVARNTEAYDRTKFHEPH